MPYINIINREMPVSNFDKRFVKNSVIGKKCLSKKSDKKFDQKNSSKKSIETICQKNLSKKSIKKIHPKSVKKDPTQYTKSPFKISAKKIYQKTRSKYLSKKSVKKSVKKIRQGNMSKKSIKKSATVCDSSIRYNTILSIQCVK